MPNLKISAMPGLGTNAAPGDLLTVVDVSAPAATANKHVTLNNFLSVITRGITDHAVRFTPPGSPPAVSLAAQGSIYFDGTNFEISVNGGAYAPLLSLSPQADHAVLIGPLSGGPTAPTWRGLALSDLPAIATDRLLGRVSPGSGDVEEITPGAGVLTWITSPTVTNLSTALGVSTTGSNNWVFSDSPTLTTPRIAQINVNSTRAVLGFVQSGNSVNYLQITNSVAVGPFTTGGPTIESVGTSADVNFWVKSKGGGNIDLSAGTLGAVNVRSLDPNNCGVLTIKDGGLIGAQLVVGGLLFGAPLGGSGTYTLPAADGTSGQAITTDGFGILSWASFAPIANPTFSGVVTLAAGTAAAPALTTTGDSNTGLAFPSADNLIFATGGLERLRIDNNGNVSIGALSPPQRRFSIEGVLPSATGVSIGFSIVGTSPTSTTSNCLAIVSNLSTAAASTLTNLIHYRAAQGTLGAGTTLTNQVGFEVLSNVAGATNNYGFSSAVPASATNYSFFSGAGAANSRFAGQVLHEAGSAAAPSITIDGDLNTGLAQIGGADTISISTGGTERLRAKSGGAIRFIPLAAAPGSPETGDVYYNSSTNKLQVYNGTIWQDCN